MDAKNYCRSIEAELYSWKAKMYDMIRKVDRLRRSDKAQIVSQVEELHKNISDMERIVEQLKTQCPIEFGTEKKQIEGTSAGMKKQYEDAMSAILQF